MRIAVNTRFLLKSNLEGIGWYSYQILKQITERHPEHEYIFFFDRPFKSSYVFNSSVTPVVLSPPARHPLLWYLWFEYAVPRALKKYKAEVFLSFDGFTSLSTEIPQYAVVHDLAYIHYPYQLPFLVRKYYQKFVPLQLKKAKHLFAVSQATKEDVKKQINIPDDKITIAYNGVRSEFVTLDQIEKNSVKEKYSRGKNYFLFVGAIHPRKNIAHLIKAFDQFKQTSRSDFLLLLVGRKAWQTADVDAAINSSVFKNDIMFYSYLETNLLAKITGASFAAVQPSFLEGFGVPVLEALYCNVPVLVSNCFSLPEVAGPGAYTFHPNDIKQISDAMLYCYKDPHRQEKIELGIQHRKQFSWEESAEIIYQKIASDIKF